KAVRVQLDTPEKEIALKRLREIVSEKQREQEGIIPVSTLREAATVPLANHLSAYVADLRAQERDARHIKDTSRRISRVLKEIGWKMLPEISASEFTAWRAGLNRSAKTKKEYLVSLNAFLNWLIHQGKLAGNPLRTVSQVEPRGKQVRQA